MINAPAPIAARAPRAPQAPAADAATGAADGADPDLAARTATFNSLAKEQAEDEREREVLEAMMLAQVKYEDEILKKWIEMI